MLGGTVDLEVEKCRRYYSRFTFTTPWQIFGLQWSELTLNPNSVPQRSILCRFHPQQEGTVLVLGSFCEWITAVSPKQETGRSSTADYKIGLALWSMCDNFKWTTVERTKSQVFCSLDRTSFWLANQQLAR